MTLEELKKGEHETVEYKQDIPTEKEKYLKTAVAFANAAGGQIIFGIQNQTWDVIGFSVDEVLKLLQAATGEPDNSIAKILSATDTNLRDFTKHMDR